MKGFEVYEYDIDENKKIIIINIEEISTELEEEINRYITEIWEGYTDGDISDVKKEILKYLGEIEEEKKVGAIAEFFIHLYLNMNSIVYFKIWRKINHSKKDLMDYMLLIMKNG